MQYKQDFYAQKAKREGYSARSVYKLEEIHKKHLPHLHKAKKILDIGAAPGSWTQYLQKHIDAQGEIITVDLSPLHIKFGEFPTTTHIQADITDPEVMESLIKSGPYDFVLSDAAPLTTGNRSVDTARSEALVEITAYIATHSLKDGGAMIAKLFQGAGASALIKELKQTYKKVLCFRPKAVKPSSFEAYIICS